MLLTLEMKQLFRECHSEDGVRVTDLFSLARDKEEADREAININFIAAEQLDYAKLLSAPPPSLFWLRNELEPSIL